MCVPYSAMIPFVCNGSFMKMVMMVIVSDTIFSSLKITMNYSFLDMDTTPIHWEPMLWYEQKGKSDLMLKTEYISNRKLIEFNKI